MNNILTNYDNKFVNEQIDHEKISKSKLFYKIYNNKISEPLHKFWFSIPNIKYANNYSEYKTIRFFVNNKNENISNLINFIKDMGNYLVKLFSDEFPNITIDYPWKESEQFPFAFSFFTNNTTLFLDSDGNNLKFNCLSNTNTYSIIFEISNLRVLPIVLGDTESYSLKINLALILIKTDKPRDLKNLISNFYNKQVCLIETNQSEQQLSTHKQNFIQNIVNNKLPFLTDLTHFSEEKNILGKNKDYSCDNLLGLEKGLNSINKSTNITINPEQLVEVRNTLKKVNSVIKKNFQDKNKQNDPDNNNSTYLKTVYLEQKNNLKKVKTNEKTFFKHLKSNEENSISNLESNTKTEKKKKKDKKTKSKLEKESELDELEKEFQSQIKK